MKKQPMANIIMKKIQKEHIEMRPKVYFVALSFVQQILLAGTFVTALLFANIALFKFRIYDPFGFLVFGKNGLDALLGLVPIYIILISILSIVGFAYTIRYFDISYRRSYVGLIMGMFLLVVGGSFVIDNTGVNEKIKESNSLPTLYYGRYTTDKWVMGEVKDINYIKKIIVLTIPFNQGERLVVWNEKTSFPRDKRITTGEYVKIIGSQDQNFFKAEGIATSTSPINH